MGVPIIVIGAGPAGIEAAKAAALAGGQVALVSEEAVGGRAGWHSLLPSKVWLTAADMVGLLSEAPVMAEAGLNSYIPPAAAIVNQIRAVKENWNRLQRQALEAVGVEILPGLANFESIGRVAIQDADGQVLQRRQAEAVIVASGSVPFFLPNLRPDGKRVLAPRFASHLDPLPEDIVVVGAGATGCEFTYFFNRLGVKVTWIIDQNGVLPAFVPEAGLFLANILAARGVHLVRDQVAERVERGGDGVIVVTSDGQRYPADMAFVAIGRKPDLGRLNLEALGLQVTPGQAPATDGYGRTGVPGLYLVGDAAGAPMVANRAMAQARVAGRHAAGAQTPPFRPETVIRAIYSEPQVAQVGTAQGEGVHTLRLPFRQGLKANLLAGDAGFLTLAYNDDRRLLGGVAAGPDAADVLAPVAMAIYLNASLDDLAAVYSAHPTISELAFMAARLA
jgi:pyruvate/2-oxoglutarate dehydrogenase complex dihydrolipoamide dehydrogenase (E3) component